MFFDKRDLNVALKEGYAKGRHTTIVNTNLLKILELTDKFCSFEKKLDNKAFAPFIF